MKWAHFHIFEIYVIAPGDILIVEATFKVRWPYHTNPTTGEQIDSEYLIKACWAKHNTGSSKPGIDTVTKVPNDIIPPRNIKDYED